LDNNRLYYVSDLRELSKSSWKSIELLPLVKDLLRKALYPTCKEKDKAPEEKKDEKKEKKKLEKAAKKEKKKLQRSLGEPVNTEQHFKNRKGETMFTEGVVSEDPETIRNTIQNISIEDKKEQDMKLEIELKGTGERKKSVSFSEDDLITLPEEVKDDSSSSSSSSDSDCTDNKPAPTTKQPKVFSGRPIKAVSGNRIRVLTKDGSVYETDRYCPHKKVDLATWGQILGNQLVCTKHNWNFNLDGLGTKGRNINPCKVNDW
jgi:nitrite reductase/ring-hydroxylating ferredoxin subunit